MVDWGLLGTAAAVIGGVSLASFLIPGFGHMVGELLGFFKSIFIWMLNILPKPLKLIIFFVLFFYLSSTIVDFTVGATHMCYEDKRISETVDVLEGDVVFKIGFFDGLGLKMSNFLSGDYISVLLEYGDVNVIDKSVLVNNSYTPNGDQLQLGYNSTHAYIDDQTVQGYNVLMAVAPTSTLEEIGYFETAVSEADFLDKVEMAASEQWDILPDCKTEGEGRKKYCKNDQEKSYLVCQKPASIFSGDTDENTCILKDAYDVDTCADSSVQVLLSRLGISDQWSVTVGYITYEYEESVDKVNGVDINVVTTEIYPGVKPESTPTYVDILCPSIFPFIQEFCLLRGFYDYGGGWFEGITQEGISGCEEVSGSSNITALGEVPIKFNYCPAHLPKTDCKSYSATVYNADLYPLKVTRECRTKDNPTGVDCSQVEGAPGKLFFDNHAAAKAQLLEKFAMKTAPEDRLTYSSKNIINYACDGTTSNEFDTNLYFLGVSIFDPKYMIFFILFGIVLSFFAYLSKFR